MKLLIVIVSVFLLLAGAGAYYFHQMKCAFKVVIVMSRLSNARTDLQKTGAFKNDEPELCTIYTHTQHFTLGGKDYRCELAAQSPWFRGRGFAAVTTNGTLLWIDKDGTVNPADGSHAPEP